MTARWESVSLGELCHIARGGSPRPIEKFLTDSGDGISWVKIGDATAGDGKYISSTREKIRPEGQKMSRLVRPGDFLLTNSMSFGRPYIMQIEGCIHDGWLVVRDDSGRLNPDYLYHFLGSDAAYRQFDALAAGSTVRNLNTELVKRVRVVVPPLAEQAHIVSILEETSAAIGAASDSARLAQQSTRAVDEHYLASAFEAAATGHGVTRLSSFATFENGDRGENYPNKSARVAQGIPFINAGHLAGQTIDMSAMDYIAEERFALLRSGKPINGDVLFCLRGSLGKFGVVEGIGPCAIASSLVIVRPKAGVSSRYIAAYFRSAMCADMIENQRSGTAQPNLGARQLANFTIPNMDTEGQNELVARVEAVAEECRQLRDLYEAKLAALAELKQSILARAFSGELTREPLAA